MGHPIKNPHIPIRKSLNCAVWLPPREDSRSELRALTLRRRIRVIRQNNPMNVAIRICSLPVRNFAGRDSESSFSAFSVSASSFPVQNRGLHPLCGNRRRGRSVKKKVFVSVIRGFWPDLGLPGFPLGLQNKVGA